MKYILLLLILILGCGSSLSNLQRPDTDWEKANYYDLDGIVAITTSWGQNHLCTGILIKENVVLTAAHCLHYPEQDLFITYGCNNIKSNTCKKAKAKKALVHNSEQRAKRQASKLAAARQYEKIKNQRTDFYHKLSKSLIERFDKIYLEKLNIKDMNSWRTLNREIQNVAWSQFVQMLLYKAERAGKEAILVDPKNTSQKCSSCGDIVKKNLSVRIHDCQCGLKIDRDLNAAINIYNRGKIILPRENGDTFSDEINKLCLFEVSRSSCF